jgi:S-DNA-T family DNA segregation ATPase FtsK/SpoIIIE
MSKRDEKEEPEEKEKKKERASSRFGHELWGVVFLALGLLVLISLVCHFVSSSENLLGPYLGSAMSAGLMFLLGRASAVLIPAGLLLIGWKNLTGPEVKTTTLLFYTAFMLEISLLFAIHNMPALSAKTFIIHGNYFGNMLVYSLSFPFGPHRFGPYFLTIFAMIITGLLFFRVNPMAAGIALGVSIRKAWTWVVAFFEPKQKDLPQVDEHEGAKKKARPVKEPASAATPAPTAKSDDVDPLERERTEMHEQELAAFRAKRHEPIQITTMGIPSEKDEPEEIPDAEIDPDILDDKELTDHSDGIAVPKKVRGPQAPYKIPSIDILTDPPQTEVQVDNDTIIQNSHILEKTLLSFGIEGKVFNVCSGPVVTRYEIELAPGVKVSKVVSLQDDISMAVGGQKIRIEAPIPGKAAIGIELPNKEKQTVYFKNIMLSEAFKKSKSRLPMIVGQNISGVPYVTDIAKMPHLLIAGQTGSGKSVCINSILCSLLMTKTPDELRLIMVDPKKVELAIYEGIPHLMSPVVTESKEAVKALYWAVTEIERRFRLLAKLEGTRNIESFNARILSKRYAEGILTEDETKPLPYLVVFVDELADLMITASKDVESHIQRIAQLGRAAGIHLIVATQRPSVDIITGPIKANLTSRIAFRTIQSTDSRTILGHVGAEKLLGNGDMLFLRNGAPDIERYHGAFLTEDDVENIVKEITKQKFETDKFENFSDLVGESSEGGNVFGNEGRDEFFEEAARMIVSMGQGSTSLLQRRMKIGYARAGRIMDELCQAGIVGAQEGSKMREVHMKPDELEMFLQQLKTGGLPQQQPGDKR